MSIQRENLKHEKQISLPTPTRSSIFGVPLEDLMGYNGEKGSVPRVVKGLYTVSKGIRYLLLCVGVCSASN
jgi:hypothetical protein